MKYKDDPINFYYINSDKYDLSGSFDYDESKVAVIVSKTKRNRYYLYEQNNVLSKVSI